MELNETAQVISYEEYHPYGTTAYQAMNAAINAVVKRYRYTGKERDEESGLNYHGARYYAPWLARWCAVDPLEGEYAGWSAYHYVLCNPVMDTDSTGMGGDKTLKKGEVIPGENGQPMLDKNNKPVVASFDEVLVTASRLEAQPAAPEVYIGLSTSTADHAAYTPFYGSAAFSQHIEHQMLMMPYRRSEELTGSGFYFKHTFGWIDAGVSGPLDVGLMQQVSLYTAQGARSYDSAIQAADAKALQAQQAAVAAEEGKQAYARVQRMQNPVSLLVSFLYEMSPAKPSADAFNAYAHGNNLEGTIAVFAILPIGKPGRIVTKRLIELNPFELEITHGLTKSKNAFVKLKADIKLNGIQEPIKFVEHSGRRFTVDGHHRLRAAKELGIQSVPVQQVDLPYAGYKSIDDLIYSRY